MSCKRCFDAFLAMLRSRKMIVQCETWGEKTKQGWGWDWALRNSQPTMCSIAHVIITNRLETYFSTKESNSNKTTKKSSYDQEDRTIKVRHFHSERKNTVLWVIYNDSKMFCSTCLDTFFSSLLSHIMSDSLLNYVSLVSVCHPSFTLCQWYC